MSEKQDPWEASALAAAIEKLPAYEPGIDYGYPMENECCCSPEMREITVSKRTSKAHEERMKQEGYVKRSDVLALLAGVSAERSENTK